MYVIAASAAVVNGVELRAAMLFVLNFVNAHLRIDFLPLEYRCMCMVVCIVTGKSCAWYCYRSVCGCGCCVVFERSLLKLIEITRT